MRYIYITILIIGLFSALTANAQITDLWKYTSSLLQPVVSTWNVYAPANFRFDGEIQPDGSTCSDGQILKKTGTNNWDCATDTTGGSGSLDQLGQIGDVSTSTIGVGYVLNYNGSTWNSTSSLYVGVDGNIGIGTTTPKTTLHVTDSNISSVTIEANQGKFVEMRSGGVGTSFSFDSSGPFSIGMNNVIGESSQDTTIMRFNNDGNVGIGTTTPAYPFVVNGDAMIYGDGSQLFMGSPNLEGGYLYWSDPEFQISSSKNIAFNAGNPGTLDFTGWMLIDNATGYIGMGTSSPQHLFTVNNGTDIQFYGLNNCDTIDTNGAGILSCGTDDTGGATAFSTTSNDYWGSQRANTHLSWSASGFDVDDDYLLNTGDTSTGAYVLGNLSLTYGLSSATGTFSNLITANGGLTLGSGDNLTVGIVQWNSGDSIDGEQIANDTIDDDSIDFTDVTLIDFTNDANFWTTTSASSWLNSSSTLSIDIEGNVTGNLTGNADTATAFSADPADCSVIGSFSRGITTNGSSTCYAIVDNDIPDTITVSSYLAKDGTIQLTNNWNAGSYYITASGFTGKSSTTDAFSTNPTNCLAGQYPLGIDANGNVESCTVASVADGSSNWIGATPSFSSLRPSTTVGITVNASSTFTGDLTVGNSKLFVDADGYVGIATSTPSSQLAVGGSVYSSGDYNTINGEVTDFKTFSLPIASSTWKGAGTSSDFYWPVQAMTISEIACIEANPNATTFGTSTVYLSDGTNNLDSIACGYTLVKDSSLSNNTWTADEKMKWTMSNITGNPNGWVLRVKYYVSHD